MVVCHYKIKQQTIKQQISKSLETELMKITVAIDKLKMKVKQNNLLSANSSQNNISKSQIKKLKQTDNN